MATLGSKLMVAEGGYSANLTERNHLSQAMLLAPHRIMDKIGTLFSSQRYYSNNPLSTILKRVSGGEITIDGTQWNWRMKAANTRPLVVKELVEPASNTKPGEFGRRFKIKLDQNWYKTTDVITPGTSSKKYNCVIIAGPVKHGDGFIYTLQLITKNQKDFVPVKLLKAGQTWKKGYSISGEAAEKGGSTQFSFPLEFSNKLSKYRKEYRITDYASTEVLRLAIPDINGGYQKSWIRYADVEFMQQWYEELEYARWYARDGEIYQDNGRPYQTGPGIQEQLEDSHREFYNTLHTKLLDQYLMDIFYGRIEPGQRGRDIVAFTGEFGMAEFHRAVSDVLSQRGLVKNIEIYTNKVQSEYNTNAYAFGMQFVAYRLTNGGTLRLVHNPLYDNPDIHTEIDPITGYPLESMRYTFLDFAGNSGNKANIKVTKKKDGDFFSYICGNYGPYGPSQRTTHPAHAGDYYEMHIGSHEGIHIEDVTKCGELICVRN